MPETHDARFQELARSTDPAVAAAIDRLVHDAPDRELCRSNPLAVAGQCGLEAEAVIHGFLQASRLGLFELSWNVLCPGCSGVLGSGATLKTVDRERYSCTLCAGEYTPTLDEMVEVTFTVAESLRAIAAHRPETLSLPEYCRQRFWGSGLDLPGEAELAAHFERFILAATELPAGRSVTLEVELPQAFVIGFEPVTHTARFLDVHGTPTGAIRELEFELARGRPQEQTLALRPGPLRVTFDNRTGVATRPGLWLAGDTLHALLDRRRPFLTAKRLLTNQAFRDLYRNDTIDVDQRLRITSLTFLFTDLIGSTALYERVGDLVAYDLVRTHFRLLQEIAAAEAGAVVKTIGDAVMATFPTPDRAVAAALRMRGALGGIDRDLALKIGIHEGPCLAVMLNERQDYFGQTVNIAARVQQLADTHSICTTPRVVRDAGVARLLAERRITPRARRKRLRGISERVTVYTLP